MVMKEMKKILTLAMMFVISAATAAFATPSTQIWIPSTDIQAFKTVHLGIDNYFRASANHDLESGESFRDLNTLDIGLTAGILPFDKVQMEVGIDFLTIASNPNDNHPLMGNFKIATPEDSFFKFQPAIAFGMYNMGPTHNVDTAPAIVSGQNILYALAAKTIPAMGPVPSLGRVSAGYYRGSKHALTDIEGHSANEGALVSWDRTMSEISDKLWVAVDYMSGNNVNGAVSFGVSWAFSKNVSLIFGYDIYKDKHLSGANTFTTQLDINIP
jgi:opacity protein-like surface antigen